MPGGIQQANFLPFIGAALSGLVGGAAGLVSGAVSAAGGAVGALGAGAGYLGSAAIGAGGATLGAIGSLGTGIIDTAAGTVFGAGEALFSGGAATPGLTVGQQMAAIAEPGYYETAAGGLFSNLSLDTLANVASVGYSAFQSAEDRKLTEKAIEAQRKAGYVVGAPAGTTALAPTTSIAIPAMAAAAKELDTKGLIKYVIIGLIAYVLLRGKK